MCLVVRATAALLNIVSVRTALPLLSVEYSVVARAKMAHSKIGYVLSVFVFVSTKQYQSI